MISINKIAQIFGYQIIKNSVTLPITTKSQNKITDDNQSIKNGIVNESKPKSPLRSKVKPKPIINKRTKRKD